MPWRAQAFTRRRVLALALLGLIGFGLWAALGPLSGYYLRAAAAQAETSLRLTVLGLDGHLRRFFTAPALLAGDPRLSALLAAPSAQGRDEAGQWLAAQAALIDAAAIHLVDAQGRIVAASSASQPDDGAGPDLATRPDVRHALDGRAARDFGLSAPAGRRAFFFSAPVSGPDGTVAGAVAIAVYMDEIEAEWRRTDEVIVVTDAAGIVFISTVADWLFRSVMPLDEARRDELRQTARYGEAPLSDLQATRRDIGGVPVLTLSQGAGARDYVAARVLMPLADWSVTVMLPAAPWLRQARLALAAVALALGLVAAGAAVVVQRRRSLAERIRLTENARADLETRIAERTADLARLNAQLAQEVVDRTATEEELRRTQADLIQAGKLAALGQMSAALSHEINQPLAAVRNYADSAGLLIDRGDLDRARGNLSQILALVDRMARIARHLNHVARKPDRPLSDVTLSVAVADALATVAPRLAAADATVTVDLPDDLPAVRAGPVRLAQVLVNLVSNAADAVQGLPTRKIAISARQTGPRVLLTVTDSGPGVPPAIAHRIFDPFFTTKTVGAGLGLGLSISFNIARDFGGDLRVDQAPGGGAMFILDLTAA